MHQIESCFQVHLEAKREEVLNRREWRHHGSWLQIEYKTFRFCLWGNTNRFLDNLNKWSNTGVWLEVNIRIVKLLAPEGRCILISSCSEHQEQGEHADMIGFHIFILYLCMSKVWWENIQFFLLLYLYFPIFHSSDLKILLYGQIHHIRSFDEDIY